jgi:2-haloacid dehalogenase/putative hydrolase of the HAD superfamily
MIKAVVFDLYGTLVTEDASANREDLDAALSRILRQAGCEVYYQEFQAARHMVFFIDYPRGRANTPQQFYAKVLERLEIPYNSDLVDKLAREATELERVKLYDDVVPTVNALKAKGIKTAILTTVPSWLFTHVLRQNKIKIDFICTAKEAEAVKPNPKIYQTVIKKLGVKPNQAIMVGDTPEIDIIPPKKLGMKAVMLCRKGEKGVVKEADHVISSLTGLLSIVGKFK